LLLATSTANAKSTGSFNGSAYVEFNVESSSETLNKVAVRLFFSLCQCLSFWGAVLATADRMTG
jgi:hypothetical protein